MGGKAIQNTNLAIVGLKNNPLMTTLSSNFNSTSVIIACRLIYASGGEICYIPLYALVQILAKMNYLQN